MTERKEQRSMVPGRRTTDKRCGDCAKVREQTDKCLAVVKEGIKILNERLLDFTSAAIVRHDVGRKEMEDHIQVEVQKVLAEVREKASKFSITVLVTVLGITFVVMAWQFTGLRSDIKSMPVFNVLQQGVLKDLDKIKPEIDDHRHRLEELEKK